MNKNELTVSYRLALLLQLFESKIINQEEFYKLFTDNIIQKSKAQIACDEWNAKQNGR